MIGIILFPQEINNAENLSKICSVSHCSLVTCLVPLAWWSLAKWETRIKILHNDCSHWFDDYFL